MHCNEKNLSPQGGGPRVVVSTTLDREVACSASDRQGSNCESCVWRTVSSQSSHHSQEVLLAQFSLYVHNGGLKPDSFPFSTPNSSISNYTAKKTYSICPYIPCIQSVLFATSVSFCQIGSHIYSQSVCTRYIVYIRVDKHDKEYSVYIENDRVTKT